MRLRTGMICLCGLGIVLFVTGIWFDSAACVVASIMVGAIVAWVSGPEAG